MNPDEQTTPDVPTDAVTESVSEPAPETPTEERFKKLTQAYDLLKDQVPFTHPFARPSFSKPAPGAGFDKNNNAWPIFLFLRQHQIHQH